MCLCVCIYSQLDENLAYSSVCYSHIYINNVYLSSTIIIGQAVSRLCVQ